MVWGEGRQTPSTLPPGVAHRNSRSENKLGGGDLGKQRSDAVPTALLREEEAGDRHPNSRAEGPSSPNGVSSP